WGPAIADALAGAVAGGRLGGWDEFVLPRMDGERAMPELLAGAFRRAGYSAGVSATEAAPYVALPPTWDEDLAGLEKKARYDVRRALRDFDAWAAGRDRLEVATTPDELWRGREVLVRLHRRRWEVGGERGTFRSPHFLAFHDQIMPAFLA